VIIAMALLTVAYSTGLWGGYLIIGIAHSLWAFPLVIMVLRVSLEGLDRSLEEAARGLGANSWQVFYTVILPLIGPTVLVAALFAFIISINEFVMALFLGTVDTETLPRIIYPTLRYSLTPLVAAASGVLMLLTVVVLLLAARIMNLRKLVSFQRSS
jgi:ABC-type spermidine/putrescine transport system permease subunit II